MTASWGHAAGRWVRRGAEVGGSDLLRTSTTPEDQNGPWMMARCQACDKEFVSGTVECLSCGARQFYKHLTAELREYTKQVEKGKSTPRKAA